VFEIALTHFVLELFRKQNYIKFIRIVLQMTGKSWHPLKMMVTQFCVAIQGL